jgi:hypothetical protein
VTVTPKAGPFKSLAPFRRAGVDEGTANGAGQRGKGPPAGAVTSSAAAAVAGALSHCGDSTQAASNLAFSSFQIFQAIAELVSVAQAQSSPPVPAGPWFAGLRHSTPCAVRGTVGESTSPHAPQARRGEVARDENSTVNVSHGRRCPTMLWELCRRCSDCAASSGCHLGQTIPLASGSRDPYCHLQVASRLLLGDFCHLQVASRLLCHLQVVSRLLCHLHLPNFT